MLVYFKFSEVVCFGSKLVLDPSVFVLEFEDADDIPSILNIQYSDHYMCNQCDVTDTDYDPLFMETLQSIDRNNHSKEISQINIIYLLFCDNYNLL